MEEPMRNRDVIALAKFPDSHKRDDEAPLPIEREDWPAPAATAAAYPELRECRAPPPPHPARRRRLPRAP